jgi:hypothetical protein
MKEGNGRFVSYWVQTYVPQSCFFSFSQVGITKSSLRFLTDKLLQEDLTDPISIRLRDLNKKK